MSKIFLILVILFSNLVIAKSVDLTTQLLNVSGTNKQFSNIPNDIKVNLEAMAVQITDPKIRKIQKETNKKLIIHVVHALKELNLNSLINKAMNTEEVREAHIWYLGELAKKITQFEINEQSRGVQGLRKYALNFKKNPPIKKRMILIGGIVKQTGSIKSNLEIHKVVALSAAIRENNLKSLDKRERLMGIIERISEKVRKSSAMISNMVYIQTFRMYETLSDQELKTYFNFLQTSSGSKLQRTLMLAMVEIFNTASSNFAKTK